MEKNEMDRVKQRYTELANALGELSGLLDSLKKTIHKLEVLAALIDLQIDAVNPKRAEPPWDFCPALPKLRSCHRMNRQRNGRRSSNDI